MGGNVWEWSEAIVSGSYRGLRGGSIDNNGSFLRASCRNIYYGPRKTDLLSGVNRDAEMIRWLVRVATFRQVLAPTMASSSSERGGRSLCFGWQYIGVTICIATRDSPLSGRSCHVGCP